MTNMRRVQEYPGSRPVTRRGTGVPHRCSTHSLRAPWLLALVLLVASLHCCHGDHHGIRCKTVQRKVPGIFLNVLRGTRDGECFLDADRKAISMRHTCTAQTCCVASDCGPAADLCWICRCDGCCAANRCNLVVGSCGVLPPPPRWIALRRNNAGHPSVYEHLSRGWTYDLQKRGRC